MALRSGASFAFNWGNRSAPAPPSPSRTIYLDSTLSEWKGKDAIRVDVYEPSADTQPSKARAAADPVKRVGVINLTAAASYSARAQMMPAGPAPWSSLSTPLSSPLTTGWPPATHFLPLLKILSTLFFRFMHVRENSTSILTVSSFPASQQAAPSHWPRGLSFKTLLAGDLFDASYIHPAIPYDNRDDPRLSPGLMPLEYMERLPPVHLCLCEMDMLLTEGLKFADNLREAGVTVTSRVVLGEKHAWDKPPPFAPKASVSVEYQAAIVAMRHWLSDDGAKLTQAAVGAVNDQTQVADGAPLDTRSRVERGGILVII
ncbi:alpha/beta hydrolase fold-3 domain-containing protein [Verticillium alfalfae VaMs.102]|uniref:Alpha/beta hydrolase fold-3 domain-containing protein n=1 Tax=Verticillium alfalfae (strain VaMs.102 / ATCC MYA-4576 / FGSC 10136) TaxID=526221 RepID=C9SD59_VERA1|nr:alpha/beta hydrolase fold-3 domain-containing protein [Verticillium alfalfae VaMs.102]EEY17024.1 alpha/beta hydrolase fold-3 domain-containing protein [Verticillium alfalfae VaMs.102]